VSASSDSELAEVFAEIARQLHAQGAPEKVRIRISRAAVETIDGCDHAGISLVRRNGRIATVGATDDVPSRVDAIQYEVGEGPCLDAIAEHEVFAIDDLASDRRWPPFSRRAVEETGVRSMLSFRLFLDSDTFGALNLYSRRVAAFDEHAGAIGTVLAAHAAIAMQSAREWERAEQLEHALVSNRVIGTAMGIVMALRRVSQQEAFAVLSQASQYLNRKLQDVAGDVIKTGEVPERPVRRG
jgi:GAF domain-containing protein